MAGRCFGTMRLLIAIFVPSEIDDEKVEKGDDDQSKRMRVSEAVKLVGAEKAEHDHGGGVGPQRIEPKGDDKESFDQTMRDEIDGGEVPCAGEMLCGLKKMNCEEFVPIKRQVMLEEEPRDVVQG